MPRGGKRPGAGRKRGSATKRTRAAADAAAANPEIKLPLDHMLDVLNNPTSTQARKDRAAECLLPFLHPRLSAVMTSALSGQGGQPNGVSETPLRVFAVPRGSSINVKTGEICFPPGVEPQELAPFRGTDDWTRTALTDQREPEPILEGLEVHEVDISNVTRLDFDRGKRDDDQQGLPDAA